MSARVAIIGGTSFTSDWLKAELIGRNIGYVSSQRRDAAREDFLDIGLKSSYSRFFEKQTFNTMVIFAGLSRSTGADFSPYFQSNILGVVSLVDYVVHNIPSIQQIIFASTSHVYGRLDCSDISEETEIMPVSHYGYSKLVAEKYLAEIAADKLTIVRPFNYTGVGQSTDFVIPKLVDVFKRKKADLLLGNTWPQRDFSDVRDVAAFYVEIIEQQIRGETINCCSGEATSIDDIIRILRDKSGHAPEINVSDRLIRDEPRYQIGSTVKAKQLGCFSRKYSIEDTLTWMLSHSVGSS